MAGNPNHRCSGFVNCANNHVRGDASDDTVTWTAELYIVTDCGRVVVVVARRAVDTVVEVVAIPHVAGVVGYGMHFKLVARYPGTVLVDDNQH